MAFKLKKQSFLWLKVVGVAAFVFILTAWFFLFHPPQSKSASLTNASATLSNPRISFYAVVDTGADIGDNAVNIKTTANTYADSNTNHLFPKDTVAVGAEGDLTVASVFDTNTFILSAGLTIPASDSDPVYATQSGTLTVTFDTTNAIPAGGDILITIDAPSSGGNDGAPDTAELLENNGFDFNGITTDEITCPTGVNWSVTSATDGSGGDGHTVVCTTNTEIDAEETLTVIIGDEETGLVNPAPAYGEDEHTQGLADVYTVSTQTRNSDNLPIDEVNIKVATIEAVLVSATVDESLTFQVQGVNSDVSACGENTDKTTTPFSVPWGRLTASDTFYQAAQQLTVSTNADNGYVVKIEENDQMGKNGVSCTGNGGEGVNCIQDTTCSDSGCDEEDGYDWIDAEIYHGLGYSLQNIEGSDAAFVYNSSDPCSDSVGDGTFCAKQIADQYETPETKATIMCGGGGDCSSNGPVNSKDIYVCYRIAFSATQPAGYYYNKVKYTASATF
ncbi:hypothetical protein MUP35_02125 [Patescibacteria group bacterium]|nr:hypothetical protein [Patescibacteria group bacterium]